MVGAQEESRYPRQQQQQQQQFGRRRHFMQGRDGQDEAYFIDDGDVDDNGYGGMEGEEALEEEDMTHSTISDNLNRELPCNVL